MGVHTLESHLDNVNKLCRVCGNREKNTMTDVKPPKSVKTMEHKFGIFMALKLRLTTRWHTQLRFVICVTIIFAIIQRNNAFHNIWWQHLVIEWRHQDSCGKYLMKMLTRTVILCVLIARNRIRVAGQNRLKKEERPDLYQLMQALQTQIVLSFNPMYVLHLS